MLRDGTRMKKRLNAGLAARDLQSHGRAPRAAAKRKAAAPVKLAEVSAAARFGDILRTQQLEEGAKRKGERTRDRLKLGAVEVLGDVGYRRLRVSDICERADISPAAFYLYFKNKKEITIEVLTEFLEALSKSARTPEGQSLSVYEGIYHSNLSWITAVRANAGLMRCLLQLSDETPEFKRLNERSGYEWFAHVTRGLLRRLPDVQIDENTMMLAVYALGGMMDEISRRLLVARDPQLKSLVNGAAPSDAAFAEFLSIIWYRALFCAEPPEAKSSVGSQLLRTGKARLDASAVRSARRN